ncbi:HIT family protein [Kitasatospora sp. NPDC096147]|uniref:HIT family protein n=1 Tax=Kitasatospora sp. NPDC096147 TaxID=3364093 RepID=UPI003821A68D
MSDHVENPYLAGLPFGQDLPAPEAASWDTFPLTGEMTVKRLEPPVLPEPPRHGEDGPESCNQCQRPDDSFVWTDEHWRLSALKEPDGLPATLLLFPRGHHDLADLPPERAAELGPLLQRVERAVKEIGGIGRVHVNRWGDGAAHLHLWLVARPEGLMQLRGSFLGLWGDLLPPLRAELGEANRKVIAAAMAEGGGTAHV